MALAGFAIYGVMGYLLSAMGYSWDTYQFWCVLGLLWAMEKSTKMFILNELNKAIEKENTK